MLLTTEGPVSGDAGLVEIDTDITETLIHDGKPFGWTRIGAFPLLVGAASGRLRTGRTASRDTAPPIDRKTTTSRGSTMSFVRLTLAAGLAAGLAVSAAFLGAGPAAAGTVSYADTVAALGPNDAYVALYNPGQGWTEVGGAAAAVYLGAPGLFEMGTGGDILQYSGTPGDWTTIGGPGSQFVMDGQHLYGLAVDYSYVAVWNGPGQGWTEIGGTADSIAAGGAGLVSWSPGKGVELYNGTPGSWTQIGGPTQASGAVAVSDTGIYVATSNGLVEQWTGAGQSWTVIGSGSDLIYAGGDGLYITVGSEQNIEQYSGTPGDWTVIGGYGQQFAVSRNALYGLGPDGDYVAQWNGPGHGWTEIGGPASWISAGG